MGEVKLPDYGRLICCTAKNDGCHLPGARQKIAQRRLWGPGAGAERHPPKLRP